MVEKQDAKIQKYLVKDHSKHIFNPKARGYVLELPRDPLLRQQVIKARKEAERNESVKTSIFNKKALVRQDQ